MQYKEASEQSEINWRVRAKGYRAENADERESSHYDGSRREKSLAQLWSKSQK